MLVLTVKKRFSMREVFFYIPYEQNIERFNRMKTSFPFILYNFRKPSYKSQLYLLANILLHSSIYEI